MNTALISSTFAFRFVYSIWQMVGTMQYSDDIFSLTAPTTLAATEFN